MNYIKKFWTTLSKVFEQILGNTKKLGDKAFFSFSVTRLQLSISNGLFNITISFLF